MFGKAVGNSRKGSEVGSIGRVAESIASKLSKSPPRSNGRSSWYRVRLDCSATVMSSTQHTQKHWLATASLSPEVAKSTPPPLWDLIEPIAGNCSLQSLYAAEAACSCASPQGIWCIGFDLLGV